MPLVDTASAGAPPDASTAARAVRQPGHALPRDDGSVDWSALPPPAAGLRCVVVVPARNEALLLPRALQALARQRGVAGQYEVLVLANNCSDDTAERALAFAAGCGACPIHVVSVAWPAALAHVGRARRALLDEAAARLGRVGGAGHRRGGALPAVLASTDADTRVAPDWLATTFAAIDAGADAVGGRIVPDAHPALPAGAQRLMRLDDVYRRLRSALESLADPDPADPWPRHHQHFGASLAVTAEAYAAVGGQPLVPYLEDEALVQALRLHDRRVRHCPAVRVHTSARLDGRAEVGLAWQLRQWADHAGGATQAGDTGACPPVPHPAAELRVWQLRRQARDAWRQMHTGTAPAAELARLCRAFCDAAQPATAVRRPPALRAKGAGHPLPPAQQLLRRMRSAPTFGSLWSALEPALQRAVVAGLPTAALPMDDAVAQLRRLLAAERRTLPPTR